MALLQATVTSCCSACGGSRCDHDGILARLLGCEDSGLCLGCLAFAFGLDKRRFAQGAVAHLRKKSCLWVAFERAQGCGCSLEHARCAV